MSAVGWGLGESGSCACIASSPGANLTRRVFAGVRKPVVDPESLAAAHERIRPMQ